jgi:SAM-dependent methyltransferase
MEFEELARSWDSFGESDPLWAILTLPGTRGGRWDPEAFFRTGEVEIDDLFAYVENLGWPLERRRALDFGCGVGRLTQALCARFERVDGVDVASSMIEGAERFNRHGDRCRYHLNVSEDLALFSSGTFDLVYSTYVLQHMDPAFARGYVREFVRVLADGGLALFQIPTARREPAPNDPLPPEAFAGVHEVLGAWPTRAAIGEHVELRVLVKNASSTSWPARGERAVRMGARWRDGDAIIDGEARADLPSDLDPGEEGTIALAILTPGSPGRYALEVGLLQEDVAWFVERGALVTLQEVDVVEPVRGEPRAAEPTVEAAEPRMEMFVTPSGEVTRWVTSAGGRVVDVAEVLSAGREFFDEGFEGALFAVARAS